MSPLRCEVNAAGLGEAPQYTGFVTSTLSSANEHIETARILLERLCDQPSVIHDIRAELDRARLKIANARTLASETTAMLIADAERLRAELDEAHGVVR